MSAGLSGDKRAAGPAPAWNRLVDRLEKQRRLLQQSEPGREVISGLLDDPRPTVRLWAAGHALTWGDLAARRALEALRDSPERVGLHATSAGYTLKEYDAGRLS